MWIQLSHFLIACQCLVELFFFEKRMAEIVKCFGGTGVQLNSFLVARCFFIKTPLHSANNSYIDIRLCIPRIKLDCFLITCEGFIELTLVSVYIA